MIDELRPRRVSWRRRRPRVAVRTLMRRTVVTGDPRQPLSAAAAVMRRHHIGALVVLDEHQRVAGIITERDLLRALADGRDPDQAHVSEYMGQEPLSVTADTAAERVAALMIAHGVRHVPITEGGRLVGIVSARDILAVQAGRHRVQPAEPW